jgi:putative flippase GtrA
MPDVVERLAALRVGHAGLIRKLLRYGLNSIVAVICSQATFIIVYGPVHASTTVASTLAWLAGAIPNYWLNRSWTWGRRGRASVTRELLPYAAIVLGTLLLAIVATSGVAAALDGTSVSRGVSTLLVSGTYFLVYAVMFGVRFVLFDRLFGSPATPS